jgi:DNA-binding transcriptional MerR regulator
MEATYTIKQASNITDLNAHTIRAWERRYKALEPGRQLNGRRLYSEKDVHRLHLLHALVSGGHSISNVASHTTDVLEVLVKSASSSVSKKTQKNQEEILETKPPTNLPDVDDKTSRIDASHDQIGSFILSNCLEALFAYNLVAIHTELESARQLLSARDFVLKLTIPLLRNVGTLVYENKMSIAQEHALSAVLRSQLMQILFNARNSIAMRAMTRKDLHKGLNFAIAAPEGDLHEFGILSAAIIIAINGHFPHYFGANMPVDALCEAATAINSDYVVVGITHIPAERRVMSDEEFSENLIKKLPTKTKIWWGGNTNLSHQIIAVSDRQRKFGSLEELDLFVAAT